MSIPEWATRHNYWNHSNTKSKPRAETLFEKVHLRPLRKKATDIVQTSTDEHDVEDAKKTLSRLAPADSAKMCAGRLVQEACDQVIIFHSDPAKVVEQIVEEYRAYTPRSFDDGKDARDWEICSEVLADTIHCAIAGIREAVKGQPIIGEIELKGCLPGNEIPHINKPDYAEVGDLKTKWPSQAATKKGYRAASLPKDLNGPFTMANVYQVAGGWHINGRKPVWLLYVNSTDFTLLDQSNCDQLQPDFLEDVVKRMAQENKVTEKMLMLADSKYDLFDLVSPDFSSLYWNDNPGIKEEARRIWNI